MRKDRNAVKFNRTTLPNPDIAEEPNEKWSRAILKDFLVWFDGDLAVLKEHDGLINEFFKERLGK